MSKSGRIAFTVRIPEELHKGLRVACAESGADLQDAVTAAIGLYLGGSGGGWPVEGASLAETQRAARFLELLRASSPELRAFLLDLVAMARKRAGLQ